MPGLLQGQVSPGPAVAGQGGGEELGSEGRRNEEARMSEFHRMGLGGGFLLKENGTEQRFSGWAPFRSPPALF